MTPAAISGRRKAATVLVALGPDLSSRVLRHLKQNYVEDLILEVLTIGSVTTDTIGQVVEEFYQRAVARDRRTTGGVDYARDLLARTVGNERVDEILGRLTEQGQPRPFDFLRQADPSQLATFLQDEHPQTIALVLAHLSHGQAGSVLKMFPVDLGSEVALRLAAMDRTSPEVVGAVEAALQKRMGGVITTDYARVGGADFMAKVLGQADRNTERAILGAIEQRNADLATEVKRLLFTFEQIATFDDRTLQRILREVDSKDLSTGLRGASAELQERILKNLSSRAAEMLREEMALDATARPKQIIEAQQRIIGIVRRLEEAEEIVIERGGSDGDG